MAPNPIPVGIVLLFGVMLLRFLCDTRPATAKRWRGRPSLVALVAGPVLAATFCAVDAFVFNAGPWAWHDFRESLPKVLCVGLVAGVIGAAAFSFVDD